MKPKWKAAPMAIAMMAIAGVALYQLTWVVRTGADLALHKVWVNRHRDAISRSADVAYGSEFLAYIDFLREQIPTGATVVDTRTFGLPQYDAYTFVQYFLIPRTIIPLTDTTCRGVTDIDECIINLSGPQTFFIYGANLTVSSAIAGMFHVLPFDQGLGLLAPQSAQARP